MKFQEWCYNCNTYDREATINVRTPGLGSPHGLKEFDTQFGNMASILERSLASLKSEFKTIEKRTKRFGTIQQRYVQEEFIRANSGQELTQKIYDRRRNIKRDMRRQQMSLGILLDQSGSTRFQVDSDNRRIDLIKYSTLTIGRSLANIGEKFFVYSYHSHSSGNPTIMEELKNVEELWDSTIEQRVASIEETSKTEYFNNRDGAAIRFANQLLNLSDNQNKYLFLITDGFPNCDYTDYSGTRAYQDTLKAMEEGHGNGINFIYLTINPDSGIDDFLNLINPTSKFTKRYTNMKNIVSDLTLVYERMKKDVLR